MREAPDFDQLARRIMQEMPTGDSLDVDIEEGIRDLARELQAVWNARGAADAQLFAGEIVELDGSEIPELIRALDQ